MEDVAENCMGPFFYKLIAVCGKKEFSTKGPLKSKFLIVQGEFCKIIDVVPRRAGTGYKNFVL